MVVYMLSAYRYLIDGYAIILFYFFSLIFSPWESEVFGLFDANCISSISYIIVYQIRYVFLL